MADNLGTPTFSYTVTAPPNARSASSVDRAGNVYVADAGNQCIRLVTPRGVVTTMAATPGGAGGFADGPEAEAQFKQPRGAAVHEAGVVCVADTLNHRIRRVSRDGQVVTLAGTGQWGHTDGPNEEATYGTPTSWALDGRSHLHVVEPRCHCVRQIMPP